MEVCVWKKRLLWDWRGAPSELRFSTTKSVAGFISTLYEVGDLRRLGDFPFAPPQMKGWSVLVHECKQSRCLLAVKCGSISRGGMQLLLPALSPSQTMLQLQSSRLEGAPGCWDSSRQTPNPQNTLVVGAILLSFTLAQSRSDSFVLDGVTLMWRRTQGNLWTLHAPQYFWGAIVFS